MGQAKPLDGETLILNIKSKSVCILFRSGE
jgi:hypothetical protein